MHRNNELLSEQHGFRGFGSCAAASLTSTCIAQDDATEHIASMLLRVKPAYLVSNLRFPTAAARCMIWQELPGSYTPASPMSIARLPRLMQLPRESTSSSITAGHSLHVHSCYGSCDGQIAGEHCSLCILHEAAVVCFIRFALPALCSCCMLCSCMSAESSS